ncbi:ATPase, T2SS/T4P/T4SS family, partial [Serratia symbiotica]
MVKLSHQSYIDNGFYDRVVGKSSSGSHNEELLQLYNNKNIPRFIEKCMEYGKTMIFCGETGSGKTTYLKTLIDFIQRISNKITVIIIFRFFKPSLAVVKQVLLINFDYIINMSYSLDFRRKVLAI